MTYKTKMGMAALLLTADQVYGKHHMHQKSYRPLPGTAPWHADQREYKWFKPEYPINYPVPDFGVDHDIIATKKHTADAEAKLGKWNPKLDKEGKAFKDLPNDANHGRKDF